MKKGYFIDQWLSNVLTYMIFTWNKYLNRWTFRQFVLIVWKTTRLYLPCRMICLRPLRTASSITRIHWITGILPSKLYLQIYVTNVNLHLPTCLFLFQLIETWYCIWTSHLLNLLMRQELNCHGDTIYEILTAYECNNVICTMFNLLSSHDKISLMPVITSIWK